MHPWHGIGHLARRAKWDEFRAWLAANPEKRIAIGTKRADGKVFGGYGVGYRNGEQWCDESTLENARELTRNVQKRLRKCADFRERFNAYLRKRYAENASVRLRGHERVKQHRLIKPEMNRAVSRKRYALKKNLMHPQHDRSKELALLAEATRLTRETGEAHQVDHIIPLGAGGWHHHENMQVLPMRVNTSKNDSAFWLSPNAEWRDWRSVPSWLWPDHLVCAYLERLYQEAILAA